MITSDLRGTTLAIQGTSQVVKWFHGKFSARPQYRTNVDTGWPLANDIDQTLSIFIAQMRPKQGHGSTVGRGVQCHDFGYGRTPTNFSTRRRFAGFHRLVMVSFVLTGT
jgi:hypothetical protein